jgi:hypothetical protein
MDHLSKYAHFHDLQHPFTTSTLVQFFMANIFKLYDMPHSIVSNHDPIFTRDFWKELFKIQGTNCISSLPIIPKLMSKLK